MLKSLILAGVLATTGAYAGSSQDLSENLSDASVIVSDGVGQVIEGTAASLGTVSEFAWDTSGKLVNITKNAASSAAEKSKNGLSSVANKLLDSGKEVITVSKDISINVYDAALDGSRYVVTGQISSDAYDSSVKVKNITLDLSKKAYKSLKNVATKSGRVVLKAVTTTTRFLVEDISEPVVGASVDTSATVLIRTSDMTSALAKGDLPEASKILIYMPADALKAAFRSGYYSETIQD